MPSFPKAFCSHIPRTPESPTPSFTLSGANTRFALAKGHPKDTQAPLITSQSSAWRISSSLMVPKEFAVSCHQVPRQPIDRKASAFRFCTHPSQEPPCPSGPGDTWQETQLLFKAQPPRATSATRWRHVPQRAEITSLRWDLSLSELAGRHLPVLQLVFPLQAVQLPDRPPVFHVELHSEEGDEGCPGYLILLSEE